MKGFFETVSVYRVLYAKPRSFYREMRSVEGVEIRMVGREPEFLQLQKALRDVFEDHLGQVVTVVGAAGLGKSRLLYEFENWADLLPEPIWYFKGRSRLETQGLPYGLLRDLFAFRFSIQEDDSAQAVRDKLETGFMDVFSGVEGGEKKAHIIGQLLGYAFHDCPHLKELPESPQQLRDQAIMYMAVYFKSLAMQNPVLILLEDLHWADEASLDALNSLAFELRESPVFLLATARHGLLERRPHWGEGQDFHRRILLEPLSKRESRELVAEVLQRVQEVPEALSELVVSNAEGNPFYVEELVKMLVEDGVIIPGEQHWRVENIRLDDVHVPPTLTGVLQARLDGLPEDERKALQGASVIGRVFWDRILEYINGALEDRITKRGIAVVLDGLRSRELIFQRETSTFAEAREHIFKHALLREVTYESVLKRVRQAYHALVAEWLIEHVGDREGEFTGLIADHLELAGNESQAGQYLLQAGKQAAEKFANQEAVRYLCRALDLTAEKDSETRYAILREREQIYEVMGNRESQEADLAALESLASALADRSKQAETALLRARLAWEINDYQNSLHAAQNTVSIAREIGNLEQEASGLLAWGRALWRQWKFEQANQKFEKVLELAKSIGGQQLLAHALHHLGNIAYIQNNYSLAIKYQQECLALYQKIGDRISEITVLGFLGTYYCSYTSMDFDFEMGLDYFKKQLALSREIGHKYLETDALNNLAQLHVVFGEYQKAWKAYQQSLPIARQLKNYLGLTEVFWGFTFISGLINHDYQSEKIFAEQGLSAAREAGRWNFEGAFYMFLADSYAGLQKWSEAEELFEQSIEILIENDLQFILIYTWESLARLYAAQGRLEKAIQQVTLILDFLEVNGFDEEADSLVLIPLHTCCQLLNTANDPRFTKVLETTFNHLQNLASKITNEDLRTSFLNNVPWNRGIIELWEAQRENMQGNLA